MGKYGTAEQATDDDIIWRMRIACWVNKPTNTHSECVILIAFPIQQWLQERTSVLRYTYSTLPVFLFCLWRCGPTRAMTSSFLRFLDYTQRRITVGRTPGRVISASQRPLPDNTQHSQQTDIHAPGGIRTHILSRRSGADLRLRPRGHWDRRCLVNYYGEFQASRGSNVYDRYHMN